MPIIIRHMTRQRIRNEETGKFQVVLRATEPVDYDKLPKKKTRPLTRRARKF